MKRDDDLRSWNEVTGRNQRLKKLYEQGKKIAGEKEVDDKPAAFIYSVIGCFVLVFIMMGSITDEARAQNCPMDWHPPPCGKPPEPVKNPLLDVLKQAAKYHSEYGAQLWGLVASSSCVGSIGEPRIDQARKAACALGAALGGINLITQQWHNRIIEQINGARDGTQFVATVPMLSFDIDTDGDPWLEALEDHRATIERLGNMIVESVQMTFDCDRWAQYDVQGITCGDNQREWTELLFSWIGERYSAVSDIEYYIANYILAPDIGNGINPAVVDGMNYDAEVNGWEGWWMRQ